MTKDELSRFGAWLRNTLIAYDPAVPTVRAVVFFLWAIFLFICAMGTLVCITGSGKADAAHLPVWEHLLFGCLAFYPVGGALLLVGAGTNSLVLRVRGKHPAALERNTKAHARIIAELERELDIEPQEGT